MYLKEFFSKNNQELTLWLEDINNKSEYTDNDQNSPKSILLEEHKENIAKYLSLSQINYKYLILVYCELILYFNTKGNNERSGQCFSRLLELHRLIGYRSDDDIDIFRNGLYWCDKNDIDLQISILSDSLESMRNNGGEDLPDHLYSMGNIHLCAGKPQETIKYNCEALEIVKKLGRKNWEAQHLNRIGLAYLDIGDIQQSLKYHLDSAFILNDIHHNSLLIWELMNAGLIYRIKGELENAAKYFEDGLRICKNFGNHQLLTNILGNLGLTYYDMGNLDMSYNCFWEALLEHRRLGYKTGEAVDLANISMIFKAKGLDELHNMYQKQSYEIYCNTRYKENGITLSYNYSLINMHDSKREFEHSFRLYQQFLALYRDTGCKQLEADTLTQLVFSDNYLNIDEAIEYTMQAQKIFNELGYLNDESHCLWRIGCLYYEKEDFDNALEYMLSSVEIDKKTLEYFCLENKLINIGKLYYLKGDLLQFIDYFTQAANIYKNANKRHKEAQQYEEIFELLQKKEEFFEAIRFYKKAIEVYNEIGDMEKAIDGLLNIGDEYYNLKDYDQMMLNYQAALDFCDDNGDKLKKADLLIKVSVRLLNNDLFEQAVLFAQKAVDISRDINNRLHEACALSAIAATYCFNDNSVEGINLYRQIIDIFAEEGSKSDEATTNECMGNFYNNCNKDFDNAIFRYLRAADLYMEAGKGEKAAEDYRRAGSAYVNKGDLNSAIIYYKKAVEISKNIGNTVARQAFCQ